MWLAVELMFCQLKLWLILGLTVYFRTLLFNLNLFNTFYNIPVYYTGVCVCVDTSISSTKKITRQ